MARLIDYGGDSGSRELDALDSVDLQALAASPRVGLNSNGHKEGLPAPGLRRRHR